MEREKKVEAKEDELKAKEEELSTQVEELRKAQAEVTQLEGELIKSHDTAAEASVLKAKLEATRDQARIAAAFAVSKFLASEEMTKIKGSSYDEGMRDFTYTVATKQLNWDLSFLCTKLSAIMAECFYSMSQFDKPLVPPSGEPPVTPSGEPLITPPPLEYRPKQVIEADPVIKLEEGDESGDDLERIDDPRGILDHQDD